AQRRPPAFPRLRHHRRRRPLPGRLRRRRQEQGRHDRLRLRRADQDAVVPGRARGRAPPSARPPPFYRRRAPTECDPQYESEIECCITPWLVAEITVPLLVAMPTCEAPPPAVLKNT